MATTDVSPQSEMTVLDPEDSALDQVPAFATGQALDAQTRGEIDIQIATAHRFPRSVKKALQEALSLATVDEDTAGACGYELPARAGSDSNEPIKGPSIRLAEIFASCWGNLRIGSRVIDEGDKFITAQGACHDLQTNLAVQVEVVRRITNKRGKRYSDDMIATTANAAQSIALRNAIFRVIPRAYVNKVYRYAMSVAVGTTETLEAKRKKWVEYFAKKGITMDRVLARLGKAGIEEIGLPEMETLIGIATAIREKQVTAEYAFPPIQTTTPPAPGAPPPASKAAAAAAHVAQAAQAARSSAPADPGRAAPAPPADGTEPPDDAAGEDLGPTIGGQRL